MDSELSGSVPPEPSLHSSTFAEIALHFVIESIAALFAAISIHFAVQVLLEHCTAAASRLLLRPHIVPHLSKLLLLDILEPRIRAVPADRMNENRLGGARPCRLDRSPARNEARIADGPGERRVGCPECRRLSREPTMSRV